MKSTRILPLALLAVAASSASAFSFTDLQIWAGSGSNQSALVVDWKDGSTTTSMAWGYRWDGTQYGNNLLDAVHAADPRFSYVAQIDPRFGKFITAFAFDADGDGRYTSPGDHFLDFGSTTGYWAYYVGGPSTTLPTWSYSGDGVDTRKLTDGSWDAWTAAPNYNSSLPVTPLAAAAPVQAVPEPATLALMGFGVLAGLRRRRQG